MKFSRYIFRNYYKCYLVSKAYFGRDYVAYEFCLMSDYKQVCISPSSKFALTLVSRKF